MTTTIHQGDCRKVLATLSDQSVHCCVTSPPYFGLRDYGTAQWDGGDPECDHKQGRPGSDRTDGIVGLVGHRNRDGVGSFGGDCSRCGATRIDSQIGLEATPDAYVAEMVAVFREVRRVLRDDGTLWLNLGDSYAASGRGGGGGSFQDDDVGTKVSTANSRRAPVDGLKQKDLIGIPWMVAFALRADGWYLRQDVIWSKPNPMPESVTDRCTKAHEYIFLMSKSARYFYDAAAIAEPAEWTAKMPDGWDTGTGAHGTIHRNGREKGKNNGAGGNTRNKRSVWEVASQPFSGARFLGDDADGSGRIRSPDCPVHGDQCAAAPMAQYDGQPDVSRPVRNRRTDNRRDGLLQGALFPTETPHDERSARANLDLPDRACGRAAIDRSNQNRKMDHAPETSRHETAAAKSEHRTDGSRLEPETAATSGRIHENNIAQDFGVDVLPSYPLAQIGGNNAGKCTCRIIDHFATFPPALIEPCILAGCPAGGTVMDPFAGAGTTGLVADRLGRSALLIELNPGYSAMAGRRIRDDAGLFAEVSNEASS